MSSSMYSTRHVWHGFRFTVSRSLLHTEFSVPRHLKVLKFSTFLRINPTYPCSPRPPSRLLDFSLQRRFQQRHYSSKIPPRDNKPTSTGSQNDLEPIPPKFDSLAKAIHENIYTLPNLLTASRIAACPVLGWAILSDDYLLATGLLAYAGVTDWVDGFLARRYNMQSVMGTILDPAADKALMTTLVITLALKDLLPLPLAVVILGRDVLLSLSAFYIRYTSLPAPKTFQRYWDFSIPSAEVRPTQISKVNTALQLLLMGVTTVGPLMPHDISTFLWGLQWTVAGTTIWSGLSYVFAKNGFRVVAKNAKVPPGAPPPPPTPPPS